MGTPAVRADAQPISSRAACVEARCAELCWVHCRPPSQRFETCVMRSRAAGVGGCRAIIGRHFLTEEIAVTMRAHSTALGRRPPLLVGLQLEAHLPVPDLSPILRELELDRLLLRLASAPSYSRSRAVAPSDPHCLTQAGARSSCRAPTALPSKAYSQAMPLSLCSAAIGH